MEDSRIDIDALALLQTNLSAKLTTLKALDNELVELVPAEKLEDEVGRADEYVEKNTQDTWEDSQNQIQSNPPVATPHNASPPSIPNPSVATPSGASLIHTQSNDHTTCAYSAVGETQSGAAVR